MAARHAATIAYFPVDLSQIFPQTGGLPLPKRAPARQAYRLVELRRWKAFLGADDLNIEPKFFPAPDRQANLMAIAAREQVTDIAAFCRAVLRACWCEDRNVADADILKALADGCGLNGAALLAAADQPATAECYDADSGAAMARGAFGAPTYIYDDEPFWGQDRLDLLDWTMAKS